MKTKITTLILSLCLIFTTPISASLKMLMDGDSGPAEDEMHFVTFLKKAGRKTTVQESKVLLSEDGLRTLKITFHMARDTVSKKPKSWGENTPWMTEEEQEQARPYLPSLIETPDANSLFEAFLEKLLEDILGEKSIITPESRLNLKLVTDTLTIISRPSAILEEEGNDRNIATSGKSFLKRKRDEMEEGEIAGGSPLKRPRLTKKFILDTLYEREKREISAQEILFERLMSGDFSHEKLYLAPGGFAHISLESFTTTDDVLENELLMRYAQRIPLNGVDSLVTFQDWFVATSNSIYKKEVYHKMPSGMTL